MRTKEFTAEVDVSLDDWSFDEILDYLKEALNFDWVGEGDKALIRKGAAGLVNIIDLPENSKVRSQNDDLKDEVLEWLRENYNVQQLWELQKTGKIPL